MIATVRELVLSTLALHPEGLTDVEGAQYASKTHPVDAVAFARRRRDLVIEGLVIEAGSRTSDAGRRNVQVWRLNPATTNCATANDQEDVA